MEDRGQARSSQDLPHSSHPLTVVLIPDGLLLLQPLLSVAKLPNQSFLEGGTRQPPPSIKNDTNLDESKSAQVWTDLSGRFGFLRTANQWKQTPQTTNTVRM